ncbi:MAG: hypothetical protein ACI9KE_003617 [Polyangiales bacterium]|jgi:hypothetical protein
MRKNLKSRIASALPKLARVIVFAAVVYGIAMAFAVREARAEVEEIMLGLGSEMMHHPGAEESRLRELRLNGAAIQMRTGWVSSSLEETLAFFEAKCQERDGRLAQQMAEIGEQLPEFAEFDRSSVDGTLTMNEGSRGYVSCLDMGEEEQDADSIITRVTRFLDTGNIADVGNLRYMYAERGEESTFYVTMFSDSDLNLHHMFPEVGDAPGTDPVARPEGSRRLLSSSETGEPYSMTIYTSPGEDVDGVATHFEESLPAEGWTVAEGLAGERISIDGNRIVTFAKGERLVTVSIHAEDGMTVSSVMMSDEPS